MPQPFKRSGRSFWMPIVILHFGAKKRLDLAARTAIKDPQSMLAWLSDDRAAVAFADLKDVQAKASAFGSLIRQWIGHVS